MANFDSSLKKEQLTSIAQILGVTLPKACNTKPKILEFLNQLNISSEAIAQAMTQIGSSKALDEKTAKTTQKKTLKKKSESSNPLSYQPNSGIISESPEIKNWMQQTELKLSQIENQIAFLMQKVTALETHRNTTNNGIALKTGDIDQLKQIILTKTTVGKAIATDTLCLMPEIKIFPQTLIERAILDLVDEEFFDVSEGSAKWKLQGNIGLLIRRK